MIYSEYNLQNFVGRTSQLEIIKKAVRECSEDSICIQLIGIMGCGKTTFIRKISQEVVASFIVDCKEKTTLESRIESLAKKYTLGGFPHLDLICYGLSETNTQLE